MFDMTDEDSFHLSIPSLSSVSVFDSYYFSASGYLWP